MLGRTHATVGLAVGLALALVFRADLPTSGAMAAVGGFGALLADIDSPNSKISRNARPARLLVFWIKHRGLTHSALILAGLTALAYHFAADFGLALAAGYASHLVADMMTIEGIPLLWPYRRNLHVLPPFLRITTGGLIESLFYFGVIAFLLWLLFSNYL